MYVPAGKSTVTGKTVVGGKLGEHLFTEQLGVVVTPSLWTSITNVWYTPAGSLLFSVIERVSPIVAVRVGPGLLPFQSVM